MEFKIAVAIVVSSCAFLGLRTIFVFVVVCIAMPMTGMKNIKFVEVKTFLWDKNTYFNILPSDKIMFHS